MLVELILLVRFLGTAVEFIEYVCFLLMWCYGLCVVDFDVFWIECSSCWVFGVIVVFVGLGDCGDWLWEFYFDLCSDGEIVVVWVGGFVACFYVVVRVGEGWIEWGEILWHFCGPECEVCEFLTVLVGERILWIRIEEWKNEVIYFDDVYLERGGQCVCFVCCSSVVYCCDD